MSSSTKSILSLANKAFRESDIETAIKLYQEALLGAKEPLKTQINFNLNVALRIAGQSKTPPQKDLSANVISSQESLDIYQPEICKYIPRISEDAPAIQKAVRVIAFYLPQFHSILQNDEWWGKGFTDWDNVKSAEPQFEGHYQPHVPDKFLGHYNLLDNQTQAKQIELAKQYGIEGFCFYIYWFKGQRLLEQPVDNYLKNSNLDLPFCVCWANENWTRRWDGLDNDLLIEQQYSAEDDLKFIANVADYLRDPRYIRIKGKPLLLVYRPNLFPDILATTKRWRDWCLKNGIGEIYLTYPQSFECVDPEEYGFDAACEFPPNNSSPPEITHKTKFIAKDFHSTIYDWRILLHRSENYQDPSYKIFRSVTPSWDNTARKKNHGIVFYNNSPRLFERWLTNAFINTRKNHAHPDEQIVFVNAWNEWAEGAHLEPDERYGFAWLDAVRNAHQNSLTIGVSELKDKTLLFIDYALPMYDRFAGSRTNFMYLSLLLKMGMKVIYLPADFKHVEPYSTELKNMGVEILAGEWFKNNWKDWIKSKATEIAYAFFHKPNPAIQFMEFIRNNTNAAIIYQCHDLHYLRLGRQAELNKDPILLDEANFFKEKEKDLFAMSDVSLTFSDVEEKIIKKDLFQNRVFTVPLFFYNSVPESKHNFNKRRDLIYVGGFEHTPNRDAVLWFCKEVLPLILPHVPDIVFNVVGANPPKDITELASANVKVLGKVSENELKTLYNNVKIAVIPLRYGAGVKGKTIETLYFGVPFVSTAIGLEGIPGINQVATPKNNPRDFAAEILTLYQNEKIWEERSILSRKFVVDHLTERKTAEQMREIFSLANKSAEERRNVAMANLNENPLRLIAFYLPQYHPIPENDKWWGKGFTEWQNVCKAKPLFPGHYQPHLPTDLGFYDLRSEESRIAQADLARENGIYGFCYYHYWFNGKRLLERPLEEMLASNKPDFPFCLCWANENWTRRWDGQDDSILMEQVYSEADDRAHIKELFKFFKDPRYIRINDKPVFLVYRTENIPNLLRTTEVWREEARNAGIGELYLLRVESIGSVNPHEIGFDAALEFAPDWNRMGTVARSYSPDDPNLPDIVEIPNEVYDKNYTRSYGELVEEMLKKEQPSYPWMRCVTPSWDNSARKKEKAVILVGSSPKAYQTWLEKVINKTVAHNDPSERFIFINAWNEWAEGNHLEPCIKWGRSYLEATRNAIEGLTKNKLSGFLPKKDLKFVTKLLGKEGTQEQADSIAKFIFEKTCSQSLIISFEDFYDVGDLTYIKGWSVINDESSSEGTEIMLLIQNPPEKTRLIIPAKRMRPEITSHFEGKRNYDFSGFEAMALRIDPASKISVIIKRGTEMFWQDYK